MPLSFQAGTGASQGRTQQTGYATIKLTRSRPPRVGIREDKLYPIRPERTYVDQTTDASLLSGDFQITTEKLAKGEATAVVKHRISPLTVTAIFLDADASAA